MVATLKNLKCLTLCSTLFWLLHDSIMCYVIMLTSSLLLYNVEYSENKEKPLNEYVSKLLTGTYSTVIREYRETEIRQRHNSTRSLTRSLTGPGIQGCGKNKTCGSPFNQPEITQ